jgi:hypothetical protein
LDGNHRPDKVAVCGDQKRGVETVLESISHQLDSDGLQRVDVRAFPSHLVRRRAHPRGEVLGVRQHLVGLEEVRREDLHVEP